MFVSWSCDFIYVRMKLASWSSFPAFINFLNPVGMAQGLVWTTCPVPAVITKVDTIVECRGPVSAPNSPSGSTGYVTPKPSNLLSSVNSASAGEKIPWYSHAWVVSAGLLMAPFHSSFFSWSVRCKLGSGHFRRKSRYKNSEL